MQNPVALVQSNIPIKSSKPVLVIVLSVVLITLLTGLVVYVWQRSAYEKKQVALQQQIISLQQQVAELQRTSPSPSATPAPSTPVATIANLQTYTNADYAFSFQYPKDWEVKTTIPKNGQEVLQVVLLSPEDMQLLNDSTVTDHPLGIDIDVFKLKGTETFTSFLADVEKNVQLMDPKIKISNKTIGNNLQTKFINKPGVADGTFDNYFQHPSMQDTIFDIVLKRQSDYQDVTKTQILSSFQFSK